MLPTPLNEIVFREPLSNNKERGFIWVIQSSPQHFFNHGILPLPFCFTVSLSKGENKKCFLVGLEWHFFFLNLYINTILPGLICRTSSEFKVYPDIIWTPNNKSLILSFYIRAGPLHFLWSNQQ